MKFIDLRSDTVTKPTEEMRKAMYEAEVGDDVYEDDPTVNRLEEIAANMVGKEAALFVPTGTFGNQLAVLTHTQRGDEVILGDDCHIVLHEVGAASVIAGVQLRAIPSENGALNVDEVKKRIRLDDDIHYPHTGLICMENAHGNGTVIPLEKMKAIYDLAKVHHIPVHLDGARLFNAATVLDVDAKEITQYTDSVMFCLSKGLCAPIGSIVAGSKDFITRARKGRKLMGGGMRQVGVIAAAGIIALEKMTKRLGEDHENAKYLAQRLMEIPGITLDLDKVQINMVFFDMSETGYPSSLLVEELLKKGIKINGEEDGLMRFVTNFWVTKDDIDFVVDSMKDLIIG
jgi:threonine aldolase